MPIEKVKVYSFRLRKWDWLQPKSQRVMVLYLLPISTSERMDPTPREHHSVVGPHPLNCKCLQSPGISPNRSAANFAWCTTTIYQGLSAENGVAKLIKVSEYARE